MLEHQTTSFLVDELVTSIDSLHQGTVTQDRVMSGLYTNHHVNFVNESLADGQPVQTVQDGRYMFMS